MTPSLRWTSSFLALALITGGIQAQVAPTMDRRPQATRAELEARLVEIEGIVASQAYTEPVKQQARDEADMIRARLRDGDFQVGDELQVSLSVAVNPGSPPINSKFKVTPEQTLQLPELPPIPLKGVLRSEVQDYMTRFLSQYFKDQTVLVQPTIRLLITGGVRNPGFYQLPADTPLPDALQAAGGISNNTKLEDTKVKRSGEELWGEAKMYEFITEAVTLDQLNLRSGDELVVGQESQTNWFTTLRTYALIPGLILSLVALGRLVGII